MYTYPAQSPKEKKEINGEWMVRKRETQRGEEELTARFWTIILLKLSSRSSAS
jgi:hypothetical protein